jgi:hypothetical protein
MSRLEHLFRDHRLTARHPFVAIVGTYKFTPCLHLRSRFGHQQMRIHVERGPFRPHSERCFVLLHKFVDNHIQFAWCYIKHSSGSNRRGSWRRGAVIGGMSANEAIQKLRRAKLAHRFGGNNVKRIANGVKKLDFRLEQRCKAVEQFGGFRGTQVKELQRRVASFLVANSNELRCVTTRRVELSNGT